MSDETEIWSFTYNFFDKIGMLGDVELGNHNNGFLAYGLQVLFTLYYNTVTESCE